MPDAQLWPDMSPWKKTAVKSKIHVRSIIETRNDFLKASIIFRHDFSLKMKTLRATPYVQLAADTILLFHTIKLVSL